MPKATAEDNRKLATLSSDCSFLLSHLIRSHENGSAENASHTLQSILNINGEAASPQLRGNPIGWYATCGNAKLYRPGTNNHFSEPAQKAGVCFTDSTLMGLKAHRDVFKAQYGLAFERDFLFQSGANPCLNIRDSLLRTKVKNSHYDSLYNYIPHELAGYVNIINESFDATYEREWRYLGDLEFEYKDVKFIFCPEKEFKIFSIIQKQGLPVLFDLAWLDRF